MSLFNGFNGFEPEHTPVSRQFQPLAFRVRPKIIENYAGQSHIMADGGAIKNWIQNDSVPSLVLWGPPGTGKTTLAHIIAESTSRSFVALSAVHAGVKDIKSAVDEARMRLRLHGRKTILFIDEIHRFNKGQQDALLPHVEDGTVTLIGATTENPSFELNSALLSRVQVITLKSLEPGAIVEILRRALPELGEGFPVTEEGLIQIAAMADGDARRALTLLENLYSSVKQAQSETPLDGEAVRDLIFKTLARQPIRYDKSGEEHYNVISAFIKSMRDSDENAALYYLARMIEAGEDPLFIARRMVIFASEDVGLGDFRALLVANAVKEAVDFVGMPEGRIPLAHGVVTLCRAKKDNSAYVGIGAAMEEVKKTGALPVPMHLRNAVTKFMKAEGYGKQTGKSHLPEAIQGKKFVPE